MRQQTRNRNQVRLILYFTKNKGDYFSSNKLPIDGKSDSEGLIESLIPRYLEHEVTALAA